MGPALLIDRVVLDMGNFLIVGFWFSLATLLYIYIGYYLLLKIISCFYHSPVSFKNCSTKLPQISVVISAFNEEKAIKKRIENLESLDYPKDKIEIIVASDGSSDKTVELAREYRNVKVLDFKENRGRASIHNDSVLKANGEIVIFSDAETIFDVNFIKIVANCFLNNTVGCIVGNLIYKTIGTSVSMSEGFYWEMEKRLRGLESCLGILATASGACMAVRTKLWRRLGQIDDCDFKSPLDVILQGQKVVYVAEAVAYDSPASSIKGELKTRVRQTSKNLIGTLQCWRLSGLIKHPFVSFGLFSHKILRWLTLFFMIGVLVFNFLLLSEALFYQVSFSAQLGFYLASIIGWIGEALGKRVWGLSTIFSFCLASVGMGVGTIKGIMGKAPQAYSSTE